MPPASAGFVKELFVNKQPLDAFECPICLNVVNDPVQCSNSHTFCRCCLTESLKVLRQCPSCRCSVVPRTLKPNLTVRNFLAECEVYCSTRVNELPASPCLARTDPAGSRKRGRSSNLSPEQPDAPVKRVKHNDQAFTAATATADCCSWRGKLKDAEAHLLQCPYAITTCTHPNCSVRVQRRALQQHQLECPYRAASCKHCQAKVTFRELGTHMASCCKRPVPCPNGCWKGPILNTTTVPLDQLAQHRAVCPREVIPCSFASTGCMAKVERCGMQKHEEDCREEHIDGLRRALQTSQEQQRVAQQKSEVTVKGLKKKVQDMAADLQGTKSKLEAAQQKIRDLSQLLPSWVWKVNLKQDADADGWYRSERVIAQGHAFRLILRPSTTDKAYHSCCLEVCGGEFRKENVRKGAFPVKVDFTLELVSHQPPHPTVEHSLCYTWTCGGEDCGHRMTETSKLHSPSYTQNGVITIKARITAISHTP